MRETQLILKNLQNKYSMAQLNSKNVSHSIFDQTLQLAKKDVIKSNQKSKNNSTKIQINKILSSNSLQCNLINSSTIPTPYNRQTVYDAISCLNSHFINISSNLILNTKYINVYCFKELFTPSNEFSNHLLEFGLYASIYCLDHSNSFFKIDLSPDSLSIFVDISEDKISATSILNSLKEKSLNVIHITSCDKLNSNNNSSFTLSINLYKPQIKNVSEKDKIKIFLNCIYLDILSKKLQS